MDARELLKKFDISQLESPTVGITEDDIIDLINAFIEGGYVDIIENAEAPIKMTDDGALIVDGEEISYIFNPREGMTVYIDSTPSYNDEQYDEDEME